MENSMEELVEANKVIDEILNNDLPNNNDVNEIEIENADVKKEEGEIITEVAEDGKTLNDVIHEEAMKPLKEEAEQALIDSVSENDLPDINQSEVEKQEEIEKISEEIIEKIESNPEKSPEEIIMEVSETLYAKIDEETTARKIVERRNTLLEKKLEEAQDEIANLKYGSGKISPADDFIWGLSLQYKKVKENPNTSDVKKLWAMFIAGLRNVYNEVEPADIVEIIEKKRAKSIEALSKPSEKVVWIIETASKPRIPGVYIKR